MSENVLNALTIKEFQKICMSDRNEVIMQKALNQKEIQHNHEIEEIKKKTLG